jgi:hypothetical protein
MAIRMQQQEIALPSADQESMVRQHSVLVDSFNQLNVTHATLHVLSVLDLAPTNAPHAKLVFILRDGREQKLLELVTWLSMALANQRLSGGLMEESLQGMSGSSMKQKYRTAMFGLLVEPVRTMDSPLLWME